MFKQGISKDETTLIKGVGILLIVFHNLFHKFTPHIGENEFTFSTEAVSRLFLETIKSPLEIVNNLFSYFGHYGVQIFILISGYGIAKSIMSKKQSYLVFIKNRLLRLYPVFVVSICMLVIYRGGGIRI